MDYYNKCMIKFPFPSHSQWKSRPSSALVSFTLVFHCRMFTSDVSKSITDCCPNFHNSHVRLLYCYRPPSSSNISMSINCQNSPGSTHFTLLCLWFSSLLSNHCHHAAVTLLFCNEYELWLGRPETASEKVVI